jgi:Fe-S cluster assembly iron-binding protein IscA
MAVESKVEENGTVIEKGDLKLILDSPSAPLRNGTDNLILAWANESLE